MGVGNAIDCSTCCGYQVLVVQVTVVAVGHCVVPSGGGTVVVGEGVGVGVGAKRVASRRTGRCGLRLLSPGPGQGRDPAGCR